MLDKDTLYKYIDNQDYAALIDYVKENTPDNWSERKKAYSDFQTPDGYALIHKLLEGIRPLLQYFQNADGWPDNPKLHYYAYGNKDKISAESIPNMDSFNTLRELSQLDLLVRHVEIAYLVEYKYTTPQHIKDYATIWPIAGSVSVPDWEIKNQHESFRSPLMRAINADRFDLMICLFEFATRNPFEHDRIELNYTIYHVRKHFVCYLNGKTHKKDGPSANIIEYIILEGTNEQEIINKLEIILNCKEARDLLQNSHLQMHNVNTSILSSAIISGKYNVLEYLLNHPLINDKIVNAAIGAVIEDQDMRALQILCKNRVVSLKINELQQIITIKWYEGLKLLLSQDAEAVNLREQDNSTALHFAIQHLDVTAVELLLNNNADLYANNDEYITPLDLAEDKKDPQILDVVQKHLSLAKSKTVTDQLRSTQLLTKLLNHDIYYMSDKLFAHIHNDYALRLSGLEGNHISDSAKYIAHVLKYNAEFGIVPANDIITKIDAIAVDENRAIHMCAKLRAENLYRNSIFDDAGKAKMQNALDGLASDLTAQVLAEPYLLIAGGWINKLTAHALIYKIQSSQHGLDIFIFNSGSGISEFHEMVSTESKTKFSSVLHLTRPGQATAEEIKKIILGLLVMRFAGYCYQNMNVDYEQIIEELTKENFKIESSIDEGFPLITPQRSGTCSWKSSMLMLRHLLADEQQYGKLKFIIKTLSIAGYLIKLDTQVDISRTQLNNLESALENFGRHINKVNIKDSLIDKEIIASGIHVLKVANSYLTKKRLEQRNKNIEHKTYKDIIKIDPQFVSNASYFRGTGCGEIYIGGDITVKPIDLDFKYMSSADLSLLDKLTALLNKTLEFARQNHKKEAYLLVQQQIINLDYDLHNIDAADIVPLLDVLSNLIYNYKNILEQSYQRPSITNYVTSISILALSIEVANQSLHKINFDVRGLSVVAITIKKAIEIDNNFYFHTPDPAIARSYSRSIAVLKDYMDAKDFNLEKISESHGVNIKEYEKHGLECIPQGQEYTNPEIYGMIDLYKKNGLNPDIKTDFTIVNLILKITINSISTSQTSQNGIEFADRKIDDKKQLYSASIDLTTCNSYRKYDFTIQLAQQYATPDVHMAFTHAFRKNDLNGQYDSDLVSHDAPKSNSYSGISSTFKVDPLCIKSSNQLSSINALFGMSDIDMVAHIGHFSRLSKISKLFASIEVFSNNLDLLSQYKFVMLLRVNILSLGVDISEQINADPKLFSYINDFFTRAINHQVIGNIVSNNGVLILQIYYDFLTFVNSDKLISSVAECRKTHNELINSYAAEHADSPIYMQLLIAEVFYLHAKVFHNMISQDELSHIIQLRFKLYALTPVKDSNPGMFESFWHERMHAIESMVALQLATYVKGNIDGFLRLLPPSYDGKITDKGKLCYPYYICNEYSINLLEGSISQQGLIYQRLPLSICASADFSAVFPPSVEHAYKNTADNYTLEYQDINYKFGYKHHSFRIQMYVKLEGLEGWYVHAQNKDVRYLPAYLRSQEYLVWQAVSLETTALPCVITARQNNRVLYAFDGKKIIEYDAEQKPSSYILSDLKSTVLNALSSFEYSDFIKVTRAINDRSQVKVQLIRYGLEFNLKTDNHGKQTFACVNYPEYKLNHDANLDSLNICSGLELTPIDSQSTLPKTVLVPNQYFIYMPERGSDPDKRLNYDIYGIVDEDKRLKASNSKLYGFREGGYKEFMDPTQHILKNQSTYYQYNLKDDSLTYSSKSHILLYCYILLGQREFRLAHDIADMYLQNGGFIGNEEERRLIEAIILHLPYRCKSDDANQYDISNKTLMRFSNNPYYVVTLCKFATQILKHDKCTNLLPYQENVKDLLAELVEAYFQALPNIGKDWRLDDTMLVLLLGSATHASDSDSFLTSHAENVQILYTKSLHNAFHSLKIPSKQAGLVITKSLTFSKYNAYKQPVSVDFSELASIQRDKYHSISDYRKSDYKYPTIKIEDLFAIQSYGIQKYFNAIEKIIKNDLPANKTVQQLKTAISELIVFGSNDKFKLNVNSDIAILGYILYCALCSPDIFKPIVEQKTTKWAIRIPDEEFIMDCCKAIADSGLKITPEIPKFGLQFEQRPHTLNLESKDKLQTTSNVRFPAASVLNITKLEHDVAALAQQIVLKSQHKFASSLEQERYDVAVLSRNINELVLDELINIFAKRCLNNVSAEELIAYNFTEELASDIYHYLLLATQLQNTDAVTLYDPSKYPLFLVLEYRQKFRLRKEQVDLINNFAAGQEQQAMAYAAQLIMGGGKSTVLAPTLAFLETAKQQLFVFVVPKSLLSSTAERLATTSAKVFGQDLFMLQFTRNSGNSLTKYKDILQTMYVAMARRGFLLTTPESLSSLELKWLELITDPNADDDTVSAIESIMRLLKTSGIGLFDEVHQTLSPKQEVNFAVKFKSSVCVATIKTSLDLYLAMDEIKLPGASKSIYELIQDCDLSITPEQWPLASKQIAEYLIYNTSLFPQIAQEDMVNYLKSNANCDTRFIINLDQNQRDKIALFKEQLQSLLPLTLNKKVLVNYGPDTISVSSDKSIAIPYEGNNIPKHGSNFASHFEVINYTIQLAIIKGVTIDDMQTFVSQLKHKALDEKRYSLGKISSIDATRTAAIFDTLCNGKYKLSSLDEQVRDELFMKFYNDFYLDKRVLHYCLQIIILPRISFFNTLLRHNEQNVMSMFDVIQGFSGTVDSTYVFRSDVKFNKESAAGVNAVTVNLLKDKNTRVSTSLEDAFNDDTRAFIDLAAFNAGVANLQVAQNLVDIINSRNLPILFVLYFDTNNNLCAIPTNDKKAKPIYIGSTEEGNIARVLNCTPSQRFTYYSQTHITGTDIQQMDNANALVTFDIDSGFSDLLQACMRMRKLAKDQTCVVVISEKVQKISPDKRWQINDILEFSSAIQDKQQANDNYKVALHKLHNIARSAILELLIQTHDRASKKQILIQANDIIYSALSDSPFKTFGGISTFNDTVKVLQEYTDNILRVLQALHLSEDDIKLISSKMSIIIDEAQNILPQQMLASNVPFDTEVQVEAAIEIKEEVKFEEQQQLKQEQSQLSNQIDSALKEAKPYKEWNDIKGLLDLRNSTKNPEIKHLQQLSARLLSQESISLLNFNETQIYLSENFYSFSMQDQDQVGLYDKAQKQINFVLFITNTDGTQNALVLTDIEAYSLKISLSKWLQENQCHVSIKILTLNGYVFYENDQSKLIDQYHIMEQLNFINGNIGYFIDHMEDLAWLTKYNCAEKMLFFKERILPLKYSMQALYATFNELVTKKYLEQNPNNDDMQALLRPSLR